MRIDANSELARAAKIQATVPPRKTPTTPDMVDLGKTDALNATLKAAPDVRAEQVARAKVLIQDPGYPSAEVVDRVAKVLARNIRGKE
jgi:hypothetical protein